MRKNKVHIASLRKDKRGMAQQPAAEMMGMTQSGLSKLERDTNPQLATLRTYIRRVLGGELHLEAEIGGERYPLALGADPKSWSGPVEIYETLEDFYAAYPYLSEGWGWTPGERERGSAPLGSDEISGVTSDLYFDEYEQMFQRSDERLVTIATPANNLGPWWIDAGEPVIGAVTATVQGPERGGPHYIIVLGANLDVRPVARALRLLQNPSLEEVGATVEQIKAEASH